MDGTGDHNVSKINQTKKDNYMSFSYVESRLKKKYMSVNTAHVEE
jgi:hypothetical protein